MLDQNVCKFVPTDNNSEAMHTLNFVFERKPQQCIGMKALSTYRMHLVVKGNGILHMVGQSFPLEEGDLFFALPSVPYCIESVADFEYMYISYIGTRANCIMDDLRISTNNLRFAGFSSLITFWKEAIQSDTSMADLSSEGILLYSFSVLGSSLLYEKRQTWTASKTVSNIKKFVDDNLTNPKLCIEFIADSLSYNKKYISSSFKRELKINLSDYINTMRIHQACALMEQGFTSAKDISLLCGYQDPLYFSRVFKRKTGTSPREYIAGLKDETHTNT